MKKLFLAMFVTAFAFNASAMPASDSNNGGGRADFLAGLTTSGAEIPARIRLTVHSPFRSRNSRIRSRSGWPISLITSAIDWRNSSGRGRGFVMMSLSPPSQMKSVVELAFAIAAKLATPATSSTSISSSRLIPITFIAISQATNLTPSSRAWRSRSGRSF